MKKYNFELTMNTRDLGGYKTLDNHETKYLRFIRSDALTFITEEEKEFLIENNITLSIDLRTEQVINKIPSPFLKDSRFEYHSFPLQEGSGIPLTDENASSLYMRMVKNYDTFRRIFTLIADTNKNVIFNCTAGKDRTGILSFLLLGLVNVSEKDILDDYEISSENIYSSIGKIIKHNPTFPKNLGYSKRIYLQDFLVMFKKKYTNVENYLHFIGLDQNRIDKIKNKLTGDVTNE